MPQDSRSKTIAGRNFPATNPDDRYVLAQGATVTPGMLLEVAGEGASPEDDILEVQPHSGAGAPVDRMIVAAVRQHPPRGDETRTLRKDQEYTEPGEMVETIVFRAGDSTDNLLLADANTVAPGDGFVSDGAGGVQKAAGDGTQAAAVAATADESRDNQTGGYIRVGGTF